MNKLPMCIKDIQLGFEGKERSGAWAGHWGLWVKKMQGMRKLPLFDKE